MSTVTNPTPHIPPPIKLMPNKPGTRKSMYRPPGSSIGTSFTSATSRRLLHAAADRPPHSAPARFAAASDRTDIRTLKALSAPGSASPRSSDLPVRKSVLPVAAALPRSENASALNRSGATDDVAEPDSAFNRRRRLRTGDHVDHDLLHRLIAKRNPQRHHHQHRKPIHPKHRLRLAEKLPQPRDNQLLKRRIACALSSTSV